VTRRRCQGPSGSSCRASMLMKGDISSSRYYFIPLAFAGPHHHHPPHAHAHTTHLDHHRHPRAAQDHRHLAIYNREASPNPSPNPSPNLAIVIATSWFWLGSTRLVFFSFPPPSSPSRPWQPLLHVISFALFYGFIRAEIGAFFLSPIDARTKRRKRA
jgi:hypothetical protein